MSQDNEEVYSLLVPLEEMRLLIPRSNVMEVASLEQLESYTGSVPWLVGSMEWESSLVPVVSFEGICGKPIPPSAGRSRVVLFRCLSSVLSSRTFGIISQGFPQLVRVSHDALELQSTEFAKDLPVLCQVGMASQSLLIPDIEQLEQHIADALAVSS